MKMEPSDPSPAVFMAGMADKVVRVTGTATRVLRKCLWNVSENKHQSIRVYSNSKQLFFSTALHIPELNDKQFMVLVMNPHGFYPSSMFIWGGRMLDSELRKMLKFQFQIKVSDQNNIWRHNRRQLLDRFLIIVCCTAYSERPVSCTVTHMTPLPSREKSKTRAHNNCNNSKNPSHLVCLWFLVIKRVLRENSTMFKHTPL